jgi:vacuolar-type H+-ATPase subunit I/STV1
VFGVAALLSVLTAILASVGLLLGIIGVILAIIGLRMSRRPGVTGRGVAIGGLVLSALAVLLGLALAAGITTFVNNEGAVDRLEKRVSDLRDKLND